MTTPDVPLRMELTFELPATAEQVWDAIATANGISSWFLRTDLEEREGGAICFHMGEGSESRGTITGWEPPYRVAYVEPDWAELSGHEGATVGPMVTEFLVEAQSGGTCSLRVVTSAFGSGADWEQEFFEEMEKGWLPFFDILRVYLTEFPGQTVTSFESAANLPGTTDSVWAALREALGASAVGSSVDVRGLDAHVLRVASEDPLQVLLRITQPVTGYMVFAMWDKGEGEVTAMIMGYLFSEDAEKYVARETPAWKAWLESLAVPAT